MIKNYSLYILFIATFISCNRELSIILPNDIQSGIEQYIQKYEYISVIYIDSSECIQCSLKNLPLWKYYRKRLNDINTGVLLIIHNSDEQAVLRELKTLEIIFPFIFDKGGKFKTSNEVFKYTRDNVFVMDKNRNAIFNESPIANEQVWKQFIGLINK
jgi:hypothetical protein